MKRIVILGSTGSIGTQVLDIVARLSERFQIVGLAANNNIDLLEQQANVFDVSCVSIGSADQAVELSQRLANKTVLCGLEGMCELATLPEADMVVVAVAGAIGIAPTHAALNAGKDIALASKEVLVAAGEVTMALAKDKGCSILPIDSEHSAIFQCLQGAPDNSIDRILLTASGGPFRKSTLEELEHVTPTQALKHPTWTMGGLVTINSATLMNKALEIIEAKWLFDVAAEDVEVVVHPQSIIHSMVQFKDGSTIAQLGLPDMRLPIQYALVYPDRVDTGLPRMGLEAYQNLTFEAPDEVKFPALRIARQCIKSGGTYPAVMNAANEAAVSQFLNSKIPFLSITRTIESVLDRHQSVEPTYDNVIAVDAWAREAVYSSVH